MGVGDGILTIGHDGDAGVLQVRPATEDGTDFALVLYRDVL